MNSFTKNGFKGFPQKVHIDTGFRGIEFVKVENPIFVPDSRMMSGIGEIYDVKSLDTNINLWRVPARRKSYLGSILSEEQELAKVGLDENVNAYKIIYFNVLKIDAEIRIARMKTDNYYSAIRAILSRIKAQVAGVTKQDREPTGFNLANGTFGPVTPIASKSKEEIMTWFYDYIIKHYSSPPQQSEIDFLSLWLDKIYENKDQLFPLWEKLESATKSYQQKYVEKTSFNHSLNNQKYHLEQAIKKYKDVFGEGPSLADIEARLKEEYEASLQVPIVAAPQPVSAPAVVVPVEEAKPLVVEKPKSKAGLIAAAVGAGLLLMGGK